MPFHVKPRKVIIHGHPTSVRLEPAFWYWLRIIAAECGMTAKKFIECIRIAHPNDPLSSTLRVQITNYFYSQSPRTGFAASGPVDVDVATGCAGYRVDVRSDAVSR